MLPEADRGVRRNGWWRAIAIIGLGALSTGAIALAAAIWIGDRVIGPPLLKPADRGSVIVVDRSDRLLRAFTTPEGRWRLPARLEDVHPRYLTMLKAYEDRRFESHQGVDPLAIIRAVGQMVLNGHVVSGGSTLTMQVARLIEERHERTATGKLRQMLRALQMERQLSKREILELYLELAPFGGNLEGVRAASLAYFGKEPERLSIGEAALLVALPQSPEARRPDLHADVARIARDRVLDRMLAAGVINPAEAAHARSESVPSTRKAFPQIAPHLSEELVAASPYTDVIETSIDRDFQASLEALAAERAASAGPRLSVAILAIEHDSGRIIAHVGSSGYLDKRRFGAIDMVKAIRSPGSTLKPIIYGLGFEAGLAHPDMLIEDTLTRFGSYVPENFDDEFHGTVSIRQALQLSLNVPAVKMLAAIGPARLTARLNDAGAHFELPPAAAPSLAVALGGVGLSLEDLGQLYAALARGGESVPLSVRRDDGDRAPRTSARRLLSPVAAWYIADILSGTPPPPNAKRGAIAYKTGTSYGYRDAWAAGFDGKHTILVWIGRPDGVPTAGLTGLNSAAPILFDAFLRLGERRVPLRSAPDGALIASGSALPPPLRRFAADRLDTPASTYADTPVAIAFPPDKAELELATDSSGKPRPLVLKAEGGVLPLVWMANDAPIATSTHRREITFAPDGRGFLKLSVIDATGKVDRVLIELR
ncbi:MAG: penicillin-binding protein 1C [Hyphomicrobiaceae bacterium]